MPFEQVAVDVVGPLEKSKSGYRFLLLICVWQPCGPRQFPSSQSWLGQLDGLLEIFSRNGIPRELLSDQGKQFMGKLMKELCSMYGIGRIQTSP